MRVLFRSHAGGVTGRTVTAAGGERAGRSVVVGYVRGVAGGLIAGLPLLYTMEVWWLGETASLLHVLVMLVFATLPVGVLVLTAGFQECRAVSVGELGRPTCRVRVG